MSDPKPIGQLYSHVYLERGDALADSETFRLRLGNFIQDDLGLWKHELAKFLAKETGYISPLSWNSYAQTTASLPLPRLLNTITLVWRYLTCRGGSPHEKMVQNNAALRYLRFVTRALSEENLAYEIDERAGIHIRVDPEFEHSRLATLKGLNFPRYAAVQAEFERAHGYLTAIPADTKGALKASFEALEILSKLMVGGKNLNRVVAEDRLKAHAMAALNPDPTAKIVLSQTFVAFGAWIDGMHNYRHGQAVETPAEPPLTLAVHGFSTAAAYLRLLVDVDQKALSAAAPPVPTADAANGD